MINDANAWRADLMRTGLIVQDDDLDADRDQADKDWRRYVELVDMVDGIEGREVFDCLLASMQVPDDYEVYEATFRALGRFKVPDVGEWIFGGWWVLAAELDRHETAALHAHDSAALSRDIIITPLVYGSPDAVMLMNARGRSALAHSAPARLPRDSAEDCRRSAWITIALHEWIGVSRKVQEHAGVASTCT